MPQTLPTLRSKAISVQNNVISLCATTTAPQLTDVGLSSRQDMPSPSVVTLDRDKGSVPRCDDAARTPKVERVEYTPPPCQPRKLVDKFRVKDVLSVHEEAGSAGSVSVSAHGDSAEDAVAVLLKLICSDDETDCKWQPSAPEAQAVGYAAPQLVLANMLIGSKKTIYELDKNETLADVARKFYGEAEVAGLIYKLNWTKIHTQFEPGMILRVRMVQGLVLQLPTANEAEKFLADQKIRRRQRKLVYEIG
ncbi:MAG TPA: hypothetical protein V6D22_22590 [Candidatus Obscuribacterales bacterium]